LGISLALAALDIGCDCGNPPTLSFSGAPPAAAVGQPYNYDVGGAGLSNPTWQVDAGSLPAGLTLAASTPTTATTTPASFSIVASDGGFTGEMAFQLTVQK